MIDLVEDIEEDKEIEWVYTKIVRDDQSELKKS